MRRAVALLLGVALLLIAEDAFAAACTRGVDCYGDCVQNTDGAGNDVGGYANASCQTKGIPKFANVVFIEDGESPGYMTSASDSVNSWCKARQDYPGSRGMGSDFSQKYGQIKDTCGWAVNTPSPATRCATRTDETQGKAAGDWEPNDAWQANSFACFDVHQSGDALAADLNAPVVYGNAIFGELRRKNNPETEEGGAEFWSDKTTLAFSTILQFSSTYLAQKTAMVKFPEWTDRDGNIKSHWHLMGSGNIDKFPFSNLLLWPGYVSNAACRAAMANAVTHIGFSTYDVSGNQPGGTGAAEYCYTVGGGGSGWISVQPVGYYRPTDWPDLTVPKVTKGVLKGLGSSNTSWKVYFGDTLILWIDGIDTTQFSPEARVMTGLEWDHYWNQIGTGSLLTQNVARWWDNLMVRGWNDSECAAAGADCGALPTLAQMEYTAPTPSPAISLSTATLTASTAAGSSPAQQTFTVQNGGAANTTLAYAVSEASAWLSVAPSSGTSTNEADTVTVTFNTAALQPGSYQATISVSDNGSNPPSSNATQNVTVNLTVGDTFAIDSVIANPASGQIPFTTSLDFSVSGTATGSILLEADCDNNGSFEKSVTDASAPWSIASACLYQSAATWSIPVRATRGGVVRTGTATATSTSAASPATHCCLVAP